MNFKTTYFQEKFQQQEKYFQDINNQNMDLSLRNDSFYKEIPNFQTQLDTSIDFMVDGSFVVETNSKHNYYGYEKEDESLLKQMNQQNRKLIRQSGQYNEEVLQRRYNQQIENQQIENPISKKQSLSKITDEKSSSVCSSKNSQSNTKTLESSEKCEDSFNQFSNDKNKMIQSEIQALKKIKEKQFLKPIQLNIMIVGEKGCGKSTFIDLFLNQFERTNFQVQSSLNGFKEYIGSKSNDQMRVIIKMIDTVGYINNDQIDKQWDKNIQKFVFEKFDKYKEQKYNQNEKNIIDDRIHVCLYFLTGPSIKANDLYYMKQLQQYTQIIPILAKGDTYNNEEVRILKYNILKDSKEHKIQFFDCQQCLKNGDFFDNDTKLDELKNGPLGPCPPFLVVSATQKINISPNKFILGRKQPWGICDANNPNHTDFKLFYHLLIGYFSLFLIQDIEQYYKKYRMKKKEKQRLKKQSKSNQSSNILKLVGGLLAASALLLNIKNIKTKF